MSTSPVGSALALCDSSPMPASRTRNGIVVIQGDTIPEFLSSGSIESALQREILSLRHLVAHLVDKIQRQESSLEQVLSFFELGLCGAVERHIDETKRMLSRVKGALEYDGREEIPSVCPFCSQPVPLQIKDGGGAA